MAPRFERQYMVEVKYLTIFAQTLLISLTGNAISIGGSRLDSSIFGNYRLTPVAENHEMAEGLKDLIIKSGLITADQWDQAQKERASDKKSMCLALARLGLVEEKKLVDLLGESYPGLPIVDIDELEVDPDVFALLPHDLMKEYNLVPLIKAGKTVVVAVDDPTVPGLKDDLEFFTGLKVELVIGGGLAIRRAIVNQPEKEPRFEDLLPVFYFNEAGENVLDKIGDSVGLVRLIGAVLALAISKKASTIHFEMVEKGLDIRFLPEGLEIPPMRPPGNIARSLMNTLMALCGLDPARTCDASLKIRTANGLEKRMEVSIRPAKNEEKIILTFSDEENQDSAGAAIV